MGVTGRTPLHRRRRHRRRPRLRAAGSALPEPEAGSGLSPMPERPPPSTPRISGASARCLAAPATPWPRPCVGHRPRGRRGRAPGRRKIRRHRGKVSPGAPAPPECRPTLPSAAARAAAPSRRRGASRRPPQACAARPPGRRRCPAWPAALRRSVAVQAAPASAPRSARARHSLGRRQWPPGPRRTSACPASAASAGVSSGTWTGCCEARPQATTPRRRTCPTSLGSTSRSCKAWRRLSAEASSTSSTMQPPTARTSRPPPPPRTPRLAGRAPCLCRMPAAGSRTAPRA
mmetsp:Transcript_63322/g.183424  ORF Transcript_63322/g.183424 Transcript_63322/m.183424 type:complete len:289 (+) Transcript_63322:134-1000(+)